MKINRRTFMREITAAATISTCGSGLFARAEEAAPAPKNILMIVADQWRWDWMPDLGMSQLDLPNLSRLIGESTHFTHSVCNSPQCAPSRISFATGLYPGRTGAYRNNTCVCPVAATKSYASNDAGFKTSAPTMYFQLMNHGYRTATVGKFDLVKGAPIPRSTELFRQLGFTDGSELAEWKGNYLRAMFPNNPELLRGYRSYSEDTVAPFPLAEEFFYDNVVGNQADGLLKKFHADTPDQPWMLLVNFHAPHPPWNAPQRVLDLYKETSFPASISDSLSGKPDRVVKLNRVKSRTMENLNEIKMHYAAKMKVLDEWLGQFMKTLEESGTADSTVIVFMADHGEMLGDFGLFSKEQMYEGSLRVPLLVRLPGITHGEKSEALVELVDLYPTLMEVAGIAYDPEHLDGRSLLPLLEDKTAEHKQYQYSEFEGQDSPPYAKLRMIFDGRYKLINTEGFLELYDLQADHQETKNLVSNPEMDATIKRLQTQMDEISANSLPPQKEL